MALDATTSKRYLELDVTVQTFNKRLIMIGYNAYVDVATDENNEICVTIRNFKIPAVGICLTSSFVELSITEWKQFAKTADELVKQYLTTDEQTTAPIDKMFLLGDNLMMQFHCPSNQYFCKVTFTRGSKSYMIGSKQLKNVLVMSQYVDERINDLQRELKHKKIQPTV